MNVSDEEAAAEPGQQKRPPAAAPENVVGGSTGEVPARGQRDALSNVRRPLEEDELSESGAQKLLLDALDRADEQLAELEKYRPRYYEADKRAAVLEERLKFSNALEVVFGVGVGLGGAIVGTVPYLWNLDSLAGVIALVIGIGLVIGAAVARKVHK